MTPTFFCPACGALCQSTAESGVDYVATCPKAHRWALTADVTKDQILAVQCNGTPATTLFQPKPNFMKMNPVDFMQRVIHDVEAFGHRDVDLIKSAASIARQTLATGFSDEVMLKQALLVHEHIKQGLVELRKLRKFSGGTDIVADYRAIENICVQLDRPLPTWIVNGVEATDEQLLVGCAAKGFVFDNSTKAAEWLNSTGKNTVTPITNL